MQRTLTVIILVGAVLAACTGHPTPVASPGVQPAPSPIPTVVAPTPDQNTGVVTGQLQLASSNSPLALILVYLGERVPLNPGPGYLITFKEKESPHIATDGEGRFALAAAPGTYALIAWTPLNSRVISDPNNPTQELLVTVTAGTVTDLGTLSVEWP